MSESPEQESLLPELLASSLDAEVELLPYLPDLLVDLEDLGVRAADVLRILSPVELGAATRVLDLGCGKGAAVLAMAKEFACTVHGVDGMRAFVEHAERRARELGVDELCVFAEADVRDVMRESSGYDLACMLGLGAVLGPIDETIADLRECVKPGGHMLIDEAYLRKGCVLPPGAHQCFDHARTVSLLEAHGDRVIAELVVDEQESEGYYRRMTAAIERRALQLVARHPEDAALVQDFVARQKEAVEYLTGPVVGALWLLRRGASGSV